MSDQPTTRATDMALRAVDVARDCDRLGLTVQVLTMNTYTGLVIPDGGTNVQIAVQLAHQSQVDALATVYGLSEDDGKDMSYTRGRAHPKLVVYAPRDRTVTRCGCGKACTHEATS